MPAKVLPHLVSPTLSVTADDPINVSVTVDDTTPIPTINTVPQALTVSEGFNGLIIWTLEGGHTFDPLGIAFNNNAAPFKVERGVGDLTTNTYYAYVHNDNPDQRGMPFAYTISVEGVKRSDPTVENDPPST